MDIAIYYVKGVAGNSFTIGDIRVAGPKPWGGGRTIAGIRTSVNSVLYALNNLYNPAHQPLGSDVAEAEMLLNKIRDYEQQLEEFEMEGTH